MFPPSWPSPRLYFIFQKKSFQVDEDGKACDFYLSPNFGALFYGFVLFCFVFKTVFWVQSALNRYRLTSALWFLLGISDSLYLCIIYLQDELNSCSK